MKERVYLIRIINLKSYTPIEGEILIKVDRSSPLGNPFKIKKESDRDKVYDDYQIYFDNKIKKDDAEFIGALENIYLKSYEANIALGCWCYPLRCHAEVIKKFIDDLRIWCYWQSEDLRGIFCTAHMAEGRCLICPYKNLKERNETNYPCSDYLPYIKEN